MNIKQHLFPVDRHLGVKHVPHQPGKPLLKLEDVDVYYENIVALQNINFELETGKRVAVIGPNGAGKSTLFKVIAGLINPSRGKVQIYGSEPGGHICVAYVAQRSQVDWNFPASVADVVMMGRVGKIGLFKRPAARDWQKVYEALEIVHLQDLTRKQISELSGGQQQRVFIARALAQEAELMLLDEPMSGLDLNAQRQIFNILDELDQSPITTMISLHDMKMARERFEKVMLINQKILGFGSAEEVFNSQALLDAYQSHIHFIADKDGQLAISDMCCPDKEGDHD